MYATDHPGLAGQFTFKGQYRDQLERILKNSAIQLVIGKVSGAAPADIKRLNWVYHVLAVCDAHERTVYAKIKERENGKVPEWPAAGGTLAADLHDETRLLIF